MGFAGIIRAFGGSLLVLAAAMLLPFFIALLVDGTVAGAYLISAVLTGFLGTGCMVISEGRRIVADFRGAILFIGSWWVITPVFGALPFWFSAMPVLDGYFEAVSALTTTGGWLSFEKAIANPADMVWRGVLQWIGGIASLAIAAAIFIRPAFIGIDTLLPPFARGDDESYLHAITNAIRALLPIYFLFTCLSFLLIAVTGSDVLPALVMALSLAASGGFIPFEDSASSLSVTVMMVIAPFIVLGGANFILVARIVRGQPPKNQDIETRLYIGIAILIGFLFWFTEGAGDLDRIPRQLLNAFSLFSTNGFIVGEAPPLVFALVTVMIGGAAVSTAGGFKVLRWFVIMRRAQDEIRRLVLPNGVFRRAQVTNELGVWIHFLVFTISLAALTLLLGLFGEGFVLSYTAATAVLANAGPVFALAPGTQGDFEVFSDPVRIILCFGMIAGRLEAVVAVAMFNRAFWRA